jgi:hypothetical protein
MLERVMAPIFDPIQKAKKVAEQAAQAALDVSGRVASVTAEIGERAAARADEAATTVAGVREHTAAKVGSMKDFVVGKIADIKDSAISGVRDIVDDLNEHLPALQEAGYTLTDLAVEVGLGPKVVATFSSRPGITQEQIDAVIDEHHDSKVTVALLRALFAAYRLQSGIQIAGMKPRGIAIEMGIPPSVVVKFA